MQQLSRYNVLLAGQVVVGRTETLENYLREKAASLTLVGIDNISAPKRFARHTVYNNKKLVKSFALPSIRVGKSVLWPFWLTLSFLLQFLSIFCIGMFASKRFDIFVGIGCFPSFVGVILKKLGKIKHCIYYCIDYFPLKKYSYFKDKYLKIILWADSFCVRNSDLTWHISPNIIEGRKKFKRLDESKYKHIIVPLCFGTELLNFRPLDQIEKHALAFVGSSGYFHGLDLIFDSIPLIIKEIPQIKVKIFGIGPWGEFIKKIQETNVNSHFIIKGFIEKDEDLLRELSVCAIGLALYRPEEGNPTWYADPGKPKLYAFCGLPSIITKVAYVHKEIQERKAGIAIDYTKEDFSKAVIEILNDLHLYRKNAYEFAKDYISKRIFDLAFKNTLETIYNIK